MEDSQVLEEGEILDNKKDGALEEGEILDCSDDEGNTTDKVETDLIFDVDGETNEKDILCTEVPELPPPPPLPQSPWKPIKGGTRCQSPLVIDRGIDLGLPAVLKTSALVRNNVASPSSVHSLGEGESDGDMTLEELDQLIENLVDEQIGGMRTSICSQQVDDKSSDNDICAEKESRNSNGNEGENDDKRDYGKSVSNSVDSSNISNSNSSGSVKKDNSNSGTANAENFDVSNHESNSNRVDKNTTSNQTNISPSKRKPRRRKRSSEVVEYGIGNLAKSPSPDFTIVDFWFTDEEDNSQEPEAKDRNEKRKRNQREDRHRDDRDRDDRNREDRERDKRERNEKNQTRYRDNRNRDRREGRASSRLSYNDRRREYTSDNSSPSKNRRSYDSDLSGQRRNDQKWRKKSSMSPSYSAQDQMEVDMLHKQQEQMVGDNYSSIPMDIEDDDSGSGSSQRSAPLPLIETVELRPPPPPGEFFKPVLDQTALTMTRSNVAWMPGFVEVLEIDADTPTPSPKHVGTQSHSPILVEDEDDDDQVEEEEEEAEEEKEEEEDVWALRAQALKSLACKRAVRAKEMNKKNKKLHKEEVSAPSPPLLSVSEKKSGDSSIGKCLQDTKETPGQGEVTPGEVKKIKTNKETNVRAISAVTGSKTAKGSLSASMKSKSSISHSPLIKTIPKKTTKLMVEIPKPSSPTTMLLNTRNRKKALYERRPNPPPPIHVPVIIHLTKEDFESDDEPDDSEEEEEPEEETLFKIPAKKRKKYLHTETLIKDLQMNIGRCRLRMKKNSTSIVRDQLLYKRVQNQMAKQRALYQEQKENVKQLQEKLQQAMREKAATMKKHNILHEELKGRKERLKAKIEVRNATDECILRAKSIVSTNRLQGNSKGIVNNKLKQQLLELLESLRCSYQQLVSADKSEDTDGSGNGVSDNATSSYESESDYEESSQRSQPLPLDKIELHEKDKQKKMLSRPEIKRLLEQPKQHAQIPKEQQEHQQNQSKQEQPEKEQKADILQKQLRQQVTVEKEQATKIKHDVVVEVGHEEPEQNQPQIIDHEQKKLILTQNDSHDSQKVLKEQQLRRQTHTVSEKTLEEKSGQHDLRQDEQLKQPVQPEHTLGTQETRPLDEQSMENGHSDALPYANLVDLQKSVTYAEVIKRSDTPMTIAYTLADLLQGLGNSAAVKELEIVSPTIPTVNPASLIPSVPSSTSKYQSPLSRFKSYRIHPKFSSDSPLSMRSSTVSNEVQANMTICQHDLLGRCNDESCGHMHIDKVTSMSTETLVRDLLSYQVNETTAEEGNGGEKQRHLNLYTNQYLKKYSDISYEQLKEFCQSKQRELSDIVMLNPRRWYNEEKKPTSEQGQDDTCTVDNYSKHFDGPFNKNLKVESKRGMENQEIRYFSKKYNSIELLKGRLGENPSDVKLWISLVHRILNSSPEQRKKKGSDTELGASNREYALSVLSQGLEENPTSQQLWIEYLKLYSLNYGSEELREVCYHAVMYAANYNVWWTCLTLESTVTGKLEICGEMIKFIQSGCEEMTPEKKSHCLTETILYATQLLVCCGQLQRSKEYLAQVLCTKVVSSVSGEEEASGNGEDAAAERAVHHMLVGDKSLLWVCLISLHMFDSLPKHLSSVEEAAPTRLVCKQEFLLDWQSALLNGREVEIRSLFTTAIESEEEVEEFLSHRMLLYENFMAFELSLGNIEPAVDILRDLVTRYPSFVDGWRLLFLLHVQFFPPEEVMVISEEALSKCHSHPIITYYCAKFLLKQQRYDLALEKIRNCIATLAGDVSDDDMNPTTLSKKYKNLLKEICLQQSVSPQLKISETLERPEITSQLYTKNTQSSAETSTEISSETSTDTSTGASLQPSTEHLEGKSQSSQNSVISSLDQSSRTYHCLCYCLLAHVGPSFRSALDAYEYVISLNTSNPHMLKTLWFACIEHKIWTISQSSIITREEFESLLDLLVQCFTCVSGISVVQDNPSVCWRDYHFHNKLIDTVLSLLPPNHHENVLCKLRNLMTHNIPLGVRTCRFHMETTRNIGQARAIYRFLLKQFPSSIVVWNCALEIEHECGSVDKVRWLLKQATKTLPFQVSLWKKLVAFEVLNAKSLSVAGQQLKAISERCLEVGIDASVFVPNVL